MRMISEAIVLRVEGRRVGHSLCMCVVSHGFDGLGGASDGGGGLYACETRPGDGCMSGDAGAFQECEVIH